MGIRANVKQDENPETILKKLRAFEKELSEEETRLRSKESVSWDEIRQALSAMKPKILGIFDDFLNSSFVSEQKKANWNLFLVFFNANFRTLDSFIVFGEAITKLEDGLLEVTSEIAKIKGTAKDVAEMKKRLDGLHKESVILEVFKSLALLGKSSFTQIQIQNIQGNIQGNVSQTDRSHVSFNQQLINAFKQAYVQVENKPDVANELKEEVKEHLEMLEQELKKRKPKTGKVQSHWKWLKKNANWVIPTITQVVMDGIKLTLGN